MNITGERGGRAALLLIPVLLALLLPRVLELDRYVTVDEPKWLLRSGSFYTALSHLDFQRTFQREHPGVTVTWAGMGGYLLSFPGYSKIAPQNTPNITRFHRLLDEYQKLPLDILVAGRLFAVIANVACLALAFWVVSRLLGALPAMFAFLLIAFDPYFTALTRLLHPDSLLTPAMFLSFIAFIAYLYQGRDRRDLLLSAVAGGLAWLTKSPAFFLAPFFGFLLLVEWVRGRGWTRIFGQTRRPGPEGLGRNVGPVTGLWRDFSPWLAWFGVAAGVFVVLWPAMWVDPVGSLSRVFSMASSYASEGHDLRLFFNGVLLEPGESAWYFYPVAYVWRATPATLLGLVLVLLASFFPRLLPSPPEGRRLAGSLVLFAVLYGMFISLGEKKFDRYLLPAFAPLTLAASLGWIWLTARISGWLKLPVVALPCLVVLGQAAFLVQSFPYYLQYYNPLVGGQRRAPQVMMVGWGEGLDQAARYLNSLPEKPRAIAWYGDGCFSYYYGGRSISLDGFTSLEDLRQSDYVVIYRDQWQRQLPSAEFLAFFEAFEPRYVVTIGSIDYARVYAMQDALPRTVSGDSPLPEASISRLILATGTAPPAGDSVGLTVGAAP